MKNVILKKIVRYFAAAFLLSGIFIGCTRVQEEPDDYVTNEGYEDTDDSAVSLETNAEKDNTPHGIPKDEIKIGVLYISDPAEGSGYSYTHELGILGMQSNLKLSDNQIESEIVDDMNTPKIEEAMEKFVADGCNIIFATSWGYMEITAKMAEKYPDVYFSHCSGYMSNGKNFNNYFGRIYQARYLSGIVAGMNTTSNKIGYVAAQDSSNSEVTGGIDAFAIGVASVNPDAKIYVSVTNSWYDEKKEKNASKKLLDMGCDVMAQHCDTSYPLTLAQKYGVYGIGYNSNMSKEVPDTCLCSIRWNWSAYYTAAVQSVIEGTWSGENYYGGMQEGLIELTSLAPFCMEGTQEKVTESLNSFLSGSSNVFDGELQTNTGEVIGTTGSTLDDAVITGEMNWYYKNVVVIE